MKGRRGGFAGPAAVAILAALAVSLAVVAGGPRPASAAAGTGEFRVPPPARTVLKNGLTVLVLERRAIPLVHFRLLVKSGSIADPAGREGTAALLARVLKRGTRSRPAQQFAEEIEFVGGEVTTSADLEQLVVTGEFASRDIEIAFNLIADMVVHPAFREAELQKEKRQQIAALIGRLDRPEEVADEALAAWLFGSHPYGRPIDGTERSVQAIGASDVTGLHAARFVPNNAVLAIVGDVGATQAAQKAERYFGAWKRRPVTDTRPPDPAPVRGRRVLLVDKPDATQAQIRLGAVGIRRSDPEYFPLLTGNTILGGGFTSLLVEEVRVKRGLTYSIHSSVQARRAPGSIVISTSSRIEGVRETIEASLEQVRRLRDGSIPEDALDKARSYLTGRFPLQIESPEGLAASVLSVEFYGLEPDFLNQFARRVRSVGADAARKTAQRYLPIDDLAIVVVGPAATLSQDLATLGPVTVRPLVPGPGPAEASPVKGGAAPSGRSPAQAPPGRRPTPG